MKIAIQTLVKSAMLYVLEQEHGQTLDQHELNERMEKYYSDWLEALPADKPRFAILDERHNVIPTDIYEYVQFYEQIAKRTVARTRVSGLEVSTVFLGLNHAYFLGQEPLWFETMVFADPTRAIAPEVAALLSQWRDNQLKRYSTWAQAEKGHAQMVRIIQEGLL
jgi:hypothetical protein